MAMIQDPNNPVPPELDEAVQLYRAFMEEIKVRLDASSEAGRRCAANRKEPFAFLDAEFACLQLRLVIELIALSAVVMHKPYGISDELLESWNDRRALTDLAQKNALGFPHPVTVNRDGGGISIVMDPKPPITRIGLQRIYNKLGRILHRGPIKHILGKGKVYDLDAFSRWAGKLRALLAHHVFMMPDQGIALVTNLTSGKDGGAEAFLAMSQGPFVYTPRVGRPRGPGRSA